MTKFLDNLALFFSALASPFLTLSVFGFILITAYSTTLDQIIFFSLSFVLLCVILPFGFIFYEIRKGKIADIHIKDRRQRLLPLAVSLGAITLTIVIYSYYQAPAPVIISLVSMLFNGLIMMAVTQYWKISLHLATLSGAITIFTIMISSTFAILAILIPFVAWSRIRRHRHTVWQVAVPSVVTPLLTLLIIWIWQTLS